MKSSLFLITLLSVNIIISFFSARDIFKKSVYFFFFFFIIQLLYTKRICEFVGQSKTIAYKIRCNVKNGNIAVLVKMV